MTLYKIADFYPDHSAEAPQGNELKGLDVYTEAGQKIGSINDILVDETGRFRYLVIDTGFWIFGKRVLLPTGQFRSDPRTQRIYLRGLSKQQAEDLPEYHEEMVVNRDYEERVRQVYRVAAVEESAPLEAAAPIAPVQPPIARSRAAAAPVPQSIAPASTPVPPVDAAETAIEPDRYRYEQDSSLYDLNEQDHQAFKLYEERLIASKQKHKAGQVIVGKQVETQTTRIAVPVRKERVTIRRHSSASIGQAVAPGTTLKAGEVLRWDIYEETADIQKQPFVREVVEVCKQVQQDIVQAEDQIRRETLDIETEGHPQVNAAQTTSAADRP